MFDLNRRILQLKLLALNIQLAYDEANGDVHGVTHTFLPDGNRSVERYLWEVDHVLIPALTNDKEWYTIVPYVQATVQPLRNLDFVPRRGCPDCWNLYF